MMVKLDGQHELEKLVLCNLESYSSVAEWISAQDAIIGDLAICDVKIDNNLRKFYILSNLPNRMNGRCSRPPWSSVEKLSLQQVSSHICNYSRSPSAEIEISIPTLPYW